MTEIIAIIVVAVILFLIGVAGILAICKRNDQDDSHHKDIP